MDSPPDPVFDALQDLVNYCKEKNLLLLTTGDPRCHVINPSSRPYKSPPSNDLIGLDVARGPISGRKIIPDERGIAGEPSQFWITVKLFNEIQNELSKEGDVRRASTWPIVRSFVYVDVSDFSRHPAGQQALIINSLSALVHNDRYWYPRHVAIRELPPEAEICTGDGYIFVFKSPVGAAVFAAHLAQLIEVLVAMKRVSIEFHYRIGVHVGEVYCFWDRGRKDWNYIGDGINGGRRVLDAIGKDADDVVFISDEVKQALKAEIFGTGAKVSECLVNRGRRKDKHKNPWRVYEVNHAQLCGRYIEGALMNLMEREQREQHRDEAGTPKAGG